MLQEGVVLGRPPSHKGQKLPVEVLTADEARALLRQAGTRSPTGLRNAALIVVLWRAGLRLAEALALKPSDVDLQQGSIRVLRGKGHKARTVGLDPGAVAIVARWIDRRRNLGLTRARPLFCTLAGEPLQPRYVRAMLQRYAAKAGIYKRVHPHGLRHTHAAELASEGVPVHVIQRQLGHANLQVTSIYLDHVAPMEVIDRIRDRTWQA